MKIYRTIRTALRRFSRNPDAGCVDNIGHHYRCAAVIAMMEIGKGSSAAIQRSIASMGANNLLILPEQRQAAG